MSKKNKFSGLLGQEENTAKGLKKKEEVLEKLSVNTGIQEPVKKAKKTKATFELDSDLHKKLKMFAAQHDKKMVEVVESALKEYFSSQNNEE
ncbi:hypothetical protein [Domibacillus tundrae]|uniref:hypothetical protein n=1 Tax=Domibacillus tundrae TaxID=1587527 RepID=UPI00061806C0|nr:hypothetical protein [Domibacillus tundrae]